MKIYKYVKSSKTTCPLEFNIEVTLELEEDIISSSSNIESYFEPNNNVISNNRYISPQELADYDAFVESIEDYLIDVYDLELTYFNTSDDNSRYYNFLAKDSEGNVLAKFRLKLRISNHQAHRSKESQQHKKEELQSPELLKYIDKSKIKKLKQINRNIIVNNTVYSDYDEAYEDITDILDEAVNKLYN